MNQAHSKPVCVIIPGATEHTGQKPYDLFKEELEEAGWQVVTCDIDWDYGNKTLTQWMDEARTVMNSLGDCPIDMVLGFSMGALMAMQLSLQFKINTIIAASPSPYLAEDLRYMPECVSSAKQDEEMAAFCKYTRSSLVNSSAQRVHIVYGEEDWPPLIPSAMQVKKILGEKATIDVLPDAPHRISSLRYYPAILQLIARCTPKEMLDECDRRNAE
jgi:pimeloyl-ACP methyl ester carboxylesterase